MAHVKEPILSWNITITELCPIFYEKHKGNRVMNVFHFQTLSELREYFLTKRAFAVARSLGYWVKVKPQPSAFNEHMMGRILFEYTDRTETVRIEFNSIQQFVNLLQDTPALADAVGYTKMKLSVRK